ncbi:MAG: hypothetical protein JXR51_12165 [Bacteroidales bacterium]|nr:hypothetical protein [Bacteroidales bacterium]MBN2757925.1 hypothetical protein [Bacteroidales bacterium]
MKKTILAILTLTLSITGFSQFGNLPKLGSKKAKMQPDQGITNEVHKKYVKQIVWSDSKISFTNPDESTFKTEFTSDMFIYARYYMPYSFENYFINQLKEKPGDMISYYFLLYVDDKLQDWKPDEGTLSGDYVQRTTQQFWIYIPNDDKYSKDVNNNWVDIVNKMSAGKHEIKLILLLESYGKKLTALEGSFTYDKKESQSIKIGKSFADLEAGMNDTNLENDILQCVNKTSEEKYWKIKYTKVKIKSNDWNVIRIKPNYTVIGKYVEAYCYGTKDGKCFVEPHKFFKEFDGAEYTNKVKYYYNGSVYEEYIDCD